MQQERSIEQVTQLGQRDAAMAVPRLPARSRPQPRAKPILNSRLAAARGAVQAFLMSEFHPREMRITKISPGLDDSDAWHAEAEMLVPDLGIKTLGLPLSQVVLSREYCVLELDARLAVKSYELLDPRDR